MSFIWDRAVIGWAAPGHRLHLEHSMQERPWRLFVVMLQDWLDEQGSVTGFTVEGTSRRVNEPDWGTLAIIGEGLLNLDAGDLRLNLLRFAKEALSRADQQTELEMQIAADFMTRLRTPQEGEI